MRFTKSLVLPAMSLLTSVSGTRALPKVYYSLGTIYGPFDNTKDFVCLIKHTKTGETTSGTLKCYYLANENMFASYSFQITSSYTECTNIPAKGRIAAEGVRYDFAFGITRPSFTIYPPNRMTLNSKALLNETVTFDNCCIGLQSNTKITSETYDFRGVNEYITVDGENRIDITTVQFGYNRGSYFKHKNAYLEILDYQDIYSGISKVDHRFTIPLSINKSASKIGFRLNSNLYVNLNTLEMSDIYHDNYVETGDFYIPIGKEKQFEQNEVNIVIEEAGFSCNKVIIPLSYFASSKLFGACYEAEYCIEGGIRG